MTHQFSGGNATPLLPAVAERHANGAIEGGSYYLRFIAWIKGEFYPKLDQHLEEK